MRARKRWQRYVGTTAALVLLGCVARELVLEAQRVALLDYYKAHAWTAVVIALVALASACLAGLVWRWVPAFRGVAPSYLWAGENVVFTLLALGGVWLSARHLLHVAQVGDLGDPGAAGAGQLGLLASLGALCCSAVSWVWLWRSASRASRSPAGCTSTEREERSE